ncbi:hypothetical protein QTN25_003759 [Entamoeba marina]
MENYFGINGQTQFSFEVVIVMRSSRTKETERHIKQLKEFEKMHQKDVESSKFKVRDSVDRHRGYKIKESPILPIIPEKSVKKIEVVDKSIEQPNRYTETPKNVNMNLHDLSKKEHLHVHKSPKKNRRKHFSKDLQLNRFSLNSIKDEPQLDQTIDILSPQKEPSQRNSLSFGHRPTRSGSSNDKLVTSLRLEMRKSIHTQHLSKEENFRDDSPSPTNTSLTGRGISLEDNNYEDVLYRSANILMKWTGMKMFKIIYNSKKHGLCSKVFNAKVCGQEHVMIVIFTKEKDVFGCYNNTIIPKPPTSLWTFSKDPDFFIFTLSNQQKTDPIRFKRKTCSSDDENLMKQDDLEGIRIYPNSEKVRIFEASNCFWIKNDETSYVNYFFEHFYECNDVNRTILTGGFEPNSFSIQNIIAVQWSD